MTTKKIIPKSLNYKQLINDPKVRDILEKSPDQKIKTVIDSLTRKHLRGKYPTKIIEGIERIGGRVTDVWYNYE